MGRTNRRNRIAQRVLDGHQCSIVLPEKKLRVNALLLHGREKSGKCHVRGFHQRGIEHRGVLALKQSDAANLIRQRDGDLVAEFLLQPVAKFGLVRGIHR